MFALLFFLFWLWVVILGLRGVAGRFGQLRNWLYTPWGNRDDLMPTLRGSIGQSWSQDEYRHYSALEARAPAPQIPDVVQGMQSALDQEKRTAEQLSRDIADWQHAIQELTLSVDGWTEKAATALGAGRNDLARAAIAERQRTQQRIKDLERDVAEMRRLLTCHASDIQSLEGQLSTVYRRNRLAETRLSAAETSSRTRELLYGEQVKDALSRFETLERSADLAEGKAEALSLGSGNQDLSSIEEQLAALEQSLPPTGPLSALPPPVTGFGRKPPANT